MIGDWQNHFSSEQSVKFDRVFAEQMSEFDLKLAYTRSEAESMMSNSSIGRIIDISTILRSKSTISRQLVNKSSVIVDENSNSSSGQTI